MRKYYEVWAYSAYTGDYTCEVGRYDTRDEAERVVDEIGECIVISPREDDAHTLLQLRDEIILGVRLLIYIGGVGHVPHYSLFSLPNREHLGFVKTNRVKDGVIDESAVAFN